MRSPGTAVAATILLSALPSPAMAADHYLLGSAAPHWSPRLLLREQPPASGDRSHPVLYVHGATFPSALSIMFRFQGSSFADALNDQGLDVFGLDFAGYGGSERYPPMSGPQAGTPVGRVREAEKQIERAVEFISRETGASKVVIIAHSWGTMPAALYAERHPQQVSALVLFGPILRRNDPARQERTVWDLVTNEQQHRRFTRDVPAGHAPVLEDADFPAWAAAYLDSDPESSARSPAAVKVPSGPSADVLAAQFGHAPVRAGEAQRAPDGGARRMGQLIDARGRCPLLLRASPRGRALLDRSARGNPSAAPRDRTPPALRGRERVPCALDRGQQSRSAPRLRCAGDVRRIEMRRARPTMATASGLTSPRRINN